MQESIAAEREYVAEVSPATFPLRPPAAAPDFSMCTERMANISARRRDKAQVKSALQASALPCASVEWTCGCRCDGATIDP